MLVSGRLYTIHHQFFCWSICSEVNTPQMIAVFHFRIHQNDDEQIGERRIVAWIDVLDALLKFNSSPLKKCVLEDDPFLLGPGNSSGGELFNFRWANEMGRSRWCNKPFEKFGRLDSLLHWCRMCKSSTKRLKVGGTFTWGAVSWVFQWCSRFKIGKWLGALTCLLRFPTEAKHFPGPNDVTNLQQCCMRTKFVSFN